MELKEKKRGWWNKIGNWYSEPHTCMNATNDRGNLRSVRKEMGYFLNGSGINNWLFVTIIIIKYTSLKFQIYCLMFYFKLKKHKDWNFYTSKNIKTKSKDNGEVFSKDKASS